MTPVQLVAVLATLLMGAVAIFQVALAAGLPLGEATMGGRAPRLQESLSHAIA